MSPPASAAGREKESNLARLLGSGSAGIAELAIFHPVDTIAKRLMSNQTKISGSSELNQVIFKDKAAAPIGRKFVSLFPGLGYAAGYKVLQRIYKYGGQPVARDFLAKHYSKDFESAFGKKTGKAVMHSTAGSLVGIGEIVLLPLDVLKIKRQTNPEAFKGRGVLKIVRDEGFGLYRGWGWTAARNAPGSFALFGGSAFAKEYLFHLEDYNKATWFQNFVASIAGASASLVVSAPLDVIKTRIQNRNFENPESGFRILTNMAKNEGFGSFFKGLVPKLLMTGPKLVFSFWLAQTLIPAFDSALSRWDSSDPERAPPPLPLNPQSPKSFTSRAGTSSAIQSAHAALSERARESNALVPAFGKRLNDHSPERALVKGGSSHRRTQTLQSGSVRDLSLMLEGGGPNSSPSTSPSKSPDKYRHCQPRSSTSSPTPHSKDKENRPTEKENVTESQHNEKESTIAGPMPGPSWTPIVRPTVRRPAPQSILGENTPPQSSTMLALQTMGSQASRAESEPPLSNVTNGSVAVTKQPQSLDNIGAQIIGLTSIATSLQKEMSALSRRSRDNATDLLSLKEATNTRDEDIRKSLRDLVGSVNETSHRLSSRDPFGSLFLDNKPHNAGSSPTNRSFQLPRIPSPKSFSESIDHASVSTPSLIGGDSAASLALLDRIIRDMGTKEGQENLVSRLAEVSQKLSGMATAAKVDELLDHLRMQSQGAIVPSGGHEEEFDGVRGGAVSQRVDALLHNEGRRSSVPTRGAEILNEDLIKIIRSVKDSVAQGGGLTAEVKALVRELRGEVLGMGRELGKRLEQVGHKSIDENEHPSKDEVSRVIDEGLEQMKDQLNHVLREHRRQSAQSAATSKSLVDYQEIYNAMRAALRDNEASQGEMPDLSREDVIEAVRDAWEAYKPEIEVQQLGLERDEVLACLREGLQEYAPRDERPAGATRDEMFQAVVEGLKHFVPPQMETPASMSRDEIIEAVRDCLEEFEFPVAASAIGADTNLSREDMVHAVKEGLNDLELPRGGAMVPHSNNDEILTRLEDLMGYIKLEFKAVSQEAKDNVAANGRDTEQVLDATKDGLENLRAAIESYVDRATGQSSQEEFIQELWKTMDEFKEDLGVLVSESSESSRHQLQTELEALREIVNSSMVPAMPHQASNNNKEILEALQNTANTLRQEILRPKAETSELLDALNDGFNDLRAGLDRVTNKPVDLTANDEIMEAINTVRSDIETIRESSNDHAVAAVPATNEEIIDAIKSVRADIEAIRESTNDRAVAAVPATNEEIIDAIKSVRADIEAIRESSNDRAVAAAPATNEEIIDAINSVRSDIEAIRESSNDRAVAAVSTADEDTSTEQALVLADMVKQDDIKNLEVLINQLRNKMEAMETEPEPESVHKEDLGRLEDMIRNVQQGVEEIGSREAPAAVPKEAAAADAPAINGDVASKEDVEAIETILRNTKARLDDLMDGEQAVRKEHLDIVETLILETRESMTSIVDQMEAVSRKDDLSTLESLIAQIKLDFDEMKEKADKQEEDPAEKVSKTDVEAVETVVLEIKNMLDVFQGVDLNNLPQKEDLANIETIVKEDLANVGTSVKEDLANVGTIVKEDLANMGTIMKEDLANIEAIVKEAKEKMEGLNESSSMIIQTKDAELTTVGDRVVEVKTFLEELQETLKGKLDDGSTGIEALGKLLESMGEKIDKNENIGTDLKDMFETMKTEFEDSRGVVAGAKLESDEKLQQAAENIGTKIDDKIGELMAKYDEFQAAFDEKSSAGEARNIETEAAVVGTKAVADELKVLVDALGCTVTDSLEKMEEASKTVFEKVEELVSRSDESQADGKVEHQQTRDQLHNAVTLVESLRGEVSENNPKILEAIQEVLALVGQHYEHSRTSTTDIQDKIVEACPSEETMLALLPAPEKFDDSEIQQKLDRLVELKYDDTELQGKLDQLAQIKYDDSVVHEKLDRLVDHSTSADQAFSQLATLDRVHESVVKTAADISNFLSNQKQRIENEHEDREKTLQDVALSLEYKRAEKDHLDASVLSLKDEEERLRKSVMTLRTEQESLIRQKTRLAGDVSSLETAMRLRKEELGEMETRAERLERRILEGVMDHSRVLLMSKASKSGGGDSMNRKRVRKPKDEDSAAAKPSPKPVMSMALSGKRHLGSPSQTGAARRIASLGQINNSNVSSGGFKRSQSVRTAAGAGKSLRKRSWGGDMGSADTDKENMSVREETVEEVDEGEPPALIEDGGASKAPGDDESDTGTLRRSSMVSGSMVSGSDLYTESEMGQSEYDETASEWTESVVSSALAATDGGDVEGTGNDMVLYGQ
ncbi:hypothetical protein ACO1O0_006397 [Amphichorda felina]